MGDISIRVHDMVKISIHDDTNLMTDTVDETLSK